MSSFWKYDRKNGEYTASVGSHRYSVLRRPGAWRAQVIEPDGHLYAMTVRMQREALALCEGHAHDVCNGHKTPTLHLAIYWDKS